MLSTLLLLAALWLRAARYLPNCSRSPAGKRNLLMNSFAKPELRLTGPQMSLSGELREGHFRFTPNGAGRKRCMERVESSPTLLSVLTLLRKAIRCLRSTRVFIELPFLSCELLVSRKT